MIRIRLAAEGESAPSDVTLPAPAHFVHLLSTGLTCVAEQSGAVTGFATAFTRGNVTFLSQLFVDPACQSGGIGQALLQAVMPEDGTIRTTIASPDPRAVSLYVRHGMTPVWPVFDLVGDAGSLRELPVSLAALERAPAKDPDIVDMDARIGGRPRPEDHWHWSNQRGGVAFTIQRRGRRTGYGYLQVGKESIDARLRGDSVRIGPIGVDDTASSYDSVLAAVSLAREYGQQLEILMPGIHPALGTLLEAGFRISDIETFLCGVYPPFVDGTRYVPSGGGLF
jgi:hypothetical protein